MCIFFLIWLVGHTHGLTATFIILFFLSYQYSNIFLSTRVMKCDFSTMSLFSIKTTWCKESGLSIYWGDSKWHAGVWMNLQSTFLLRKINVIASASLPGWPRKKVHLTLYKAAWRPWVFCLRAKLRRVDWFKQQIPYLTLLKHWRPCQLGVVDSPSTCLTAPLLPLLQRFLCKIRGQEIRNTCAHRFTHSLTVTWGIQGGSVVRIILQQCSFDPWVGRSLEKEMAATPVFLHLENCMDKRSPMGYSWSSPFDHVQDYLWLHGPGPIPSQLLELT